MSTIANRIVAPALVVIEDAQDQPWLTFLANLRQALPTYLVAFERLQTIGAPADSILAELVAHEHAIDQFAELEGDGRSTDALAVLEGHLDAAGARPILDRETT